MINKKLEKLLEEAIAKRQALKESELGSAAAEPVYGSGEAKEHTPELDNKDVYPADEHEQAEEVEEVIVETYTREDLLELFEALNLDTDKYTFVYLAEQLGFVPEGEVEMEQPEVVEMQPQQDPEYDEEGSMAKSQLITIADAAAELYNMMEDETNLPEWVQSKLTLSKEYIDTARDYLKSEMIKQSQDMAEMQTQPEMEEVPAEAVEQSLQERYVLKRPVGRPSKKSKMLDAKGGTELSEKGEVVYTRNKK
jgi:hypothetical protein